MIVVLFLCRSRSTKEHFDAADLDKIQCDDLKSQILELRHIRASVNNELRDLENKRLGLQTEISKQKTELESFRMQQENVEKELRQLTLNLDQMKVQEREFSNQIQPLLKAPQMFIFPDETKNIRPALSSPRGCSMHICFDYSKCALLSGFPVYVYGVEKMADDRSLNEFVRSSVYKALSGSTYRTDSADKACLYIALLGEEALHKSSENIQTQLNNLPYWNGDGLNHVLINFAQTSRGFDLFEGVDTGRAIIVQSSFIETKFRQKFDIVTPPLMGKSEGPVWEELLPLNPIRRVFFLSFYGQFIENSGSEDKPAKNSNDFINSDQNFRVRNLQAPADVVFFDKSKSLYSRLKELETFIVENLKNMETNAEEKLTLRFICDSGAVKVGVYGEWALCGTEADRGKTLKQSTFSIIIAPANFSVVSTTVFQTRIFESLKYGSIPVILGDYSELPFAELLDWSRAAIILPKPRVTELYFILRTLSNVDVMEFKRNGRVFWETFFGTTESVVSTVLAVLRTRLNIPAHPVKEEPSENSVSNFIPVPQHISKC